MSLNNIIKSALIEDIGKGDITTQLLIPKSKQIKALIIVKEQGVICGIDVAAEVFKARDKRIKFKKLARDGQQVAKDEIIATLSGRAQGILTAERVALNFLGTLAGIATRTRQFVDAAKPHKVKILDTRKTIPGLRELEKYAVRMGGGYNHRMRLDGMVLVKDNHLAVLRSAHCVLRFENIAREIEKKHKNVKIEIEVKNLKEFKEAIKLKPDIIMLDNMSIAQIKQAVTILRNTQITQRRATKLEASGNINLGDIRKYAATGVDFISIGSLTKDIQSLDMSLEVV